MSEQANTYYESWKLELTGEPVELSSVIDVRDGTHASPKPQDEGYPLVTSKHLFEYDVDLDSPNKISQDLLSQFEDNIKEDRTAEDLKINIGCVYPRMQRLEMEVRGRHLATGLPVNLVVNSDDMLEALKEPAAQVVEAVLSILERTPPELSADISDRGIYMTGGGCLVHGLDKLLQEKTGINVMIAEESVSCVAIGTGKALDDPEMLQKLDAKARTPKY